MAVAMKKKQAKREAQIASLSQTDADLFPKSLMFTMRKQSMAKDQPAPTATKFFIPHHFRTSILKAIASTAAGKATGRDKIHNEMLKAAPEPTADLILENGVFVVALQLSSGNGSVRKRNCRSRPTNAETEGKPRTIDPKASFRTYGRSSKGQSHAKFGVASHHTQCKRDFRRLSVR